MAPANMEFTVKVSYMEIYMEKVRDLLNRKSTHSPEFAGQTASLTILITITVNSLSRQPSNS
jgi:kinesin family member 5